MHPAPLRHAQVRELISGCDAAKRETASLSKKLDEQRQRAQIEAESAVRGRTALLQPCTSSSATAAPLRSTPAHQLRHRRTAALPTLHICTATAAPLLQSLENSSAVVADLCSGRGAQARRIRELEGMLHDARDVASKREWWQVRRRDAAAAGRAATRRPAMRPRTRPRH